MEDDFLEDLRKGVSHKLYQKAISFFINHPDRWFSRKQIQEALGIGKTQCCRLFIALTNVACLENNEDDRPADNSPLRLRLNSGDLKNAQKELSQISSLTNEDRMLLTILMDMAESTGLYGNMVSSLKNHLSMSRFAEKGIIPMVSYSPEMKNDGGDNHLIPIVLNAIEKNKSIWITYKSPWSETEKRYTVNPIGLFTQNDILYLYSFNPYFEHTVIHAFSRIKDISIFENADTPEEYKDLSQIIDPFGIVTDDETMTVTVWIDPDQAIFEREAARAKHASITENIDGSITMTIQTRNRYSCKRWIMGLGNQIKCLAPAELIEEIMAEAKKTFEMYN